MLSASELVEARRLCGYPAFGSGANDDSFNRYFAEYRTLEYRLANLTDAELAVARKYLMQLAAMEAGIVTAADNLDTDQASVWKRNRDEVADRERLFDGWRRRLCAFLGVPPGPALAGNGNSIRLVI